MCHIMSVKNWKNIGKTAKYLLTLLPKYVILQL